MAMIGSRLRVLLNALNDFVGPEQTDGKTPLIALIALITFGCYDLTLIIICCQIILPGLQLCPNIIFVDVGIAPTACTLF